MRILIVEDETKLRKQLSVALKNKNFVIEEASDGEEALYLGLEYSFDLAIVDLGLPKINGIEVIKQWREKRVNFPIIILTARGHWEDKVEGLDAGADDYLVKPFHLEELFSRVNALIRRSKGNAKSTLSFADNTLVLDLSAKTICLHQLPIELTAYEYNTFEYLALHQGKTISKTELTDHLYEQDFDRDSNVIEVFVGRLRKKLDPEGCLKIIQTVRGQGYRFDLEADD